MPGRGTPGTATNSYWDTQTTGQSTSAGGTGLQTAQLVRDPERLRVRPWTTAPGNYPFLAGQPTRCRCRATGGRPATIRSRSSHSPQFRRTQPDHVVDNTSIVQISPQANALRPRNRHRRSPRSELVINNQSGGSSSGGRQFARRQKGGGAAGGARPPANVVAAFGLGPLPSGMPPLNETRFLNDEVVIQLGAGASRDQELARR